MRIRRKSNTARGFHFRMHELACAILGNNLHRPFYARLVSSFALSTSRCKATLCLFFNPLFFSVFGDRCFASFSPLRFFVFFSSASLSSVSSFQPVLSPFSHRSSLFHVEISILDGGGQRAKRRKPDGKSVE